MRFRVGCIGITAGVPPRLYRFAPANHHSTIHNTCASPPPELCDNSDQAEQCHILALKLGASSLTQHLAGYRKRKFFGVKIGIVH
jgi:hypothetical protein